MGTQIEWTESFDNNTITYNGTIVGTTQNIFGKVYLIVSVEGLAFRKIPAKMKNTTRL